MNLRNKLTFQFTLIVASILFVFTLFIFWVYLDERKRDFYGSLSEKGTEAARIMLDTSIEPNLKNDLLRQLKADTTWSLNLYDTSNRLVLSIGKSHHQPSLQTVRSVLSGKRIVDDKGPYARLLFKLSDHGQYFCAAVTGRDFHEKEDIEYFSLSLSVTFALTFLLVLVFAFVHAGRALKPVARIIEQVDRITDQSLYARIDEGNGKDEMSKLAKTFNRMFVRLRHSFILQHGFISNASHELRTPLTVISGQLEVSLMKARSNEEYKELLLSVYDDLKNLSRLSDGLLNFMSADTDPEKVAMSAIPVSDLLWRTRAEIIRLNPTYNIAMRFENDSSRNDFMIRCNEQLLGIAFGNLMDNACKYSEDRHVMVGVSAHADSIKISFKDNGIGIEKEQLKRIFDPFFRADNARSKRGHGLGLAMVSKIVSIHRGSISVDSQVRMGTVFSLVLPLHDGK
jgi:signal transduction histidine kinase